MGIERIQRISKNNFITDYFNNHKPVIFESMFDNRETDSLEKIVGKCEDYKFMVTKEFINNFAETKSFWQTPDYMKLNDYLKFIKTTPGTKKAIRVSKSPEALSNQFKIPEYCHVRNDEVICQSFCANIGNFSRLHFDKFSSHALIYQLTGIKRVVLIPAKASFKLLPTFHLSRVLLENFSDKDRAKFLNFTGGWETILFPGDVLYLPMMMWHHFDYLDTSFSLTFRFGRNKFAEFLEKNCHFDMYLQNIAAFLDQDANKDLSSTIVNEIKNVTDNIELPPDKKFLALKLLYKTLYRKYCTNGESCSYYLSNDIDLSENNSSLIKYLGINRYLRNEG